MFVGFVGRLVCQQDSPKTAKQISTTFGWRICFSPEYALLAFVADLDKGMDPGSPCEPKGKVLFASAYLQVSCKNCQVGMAISFVLVAFLVVNS